MQPMKSEVSVFWWQLMLKSGWLLRAAKTWHKEVFPQPVSPTRSTGSRFYRHLCTSTANLFNCLVMMSRGTPSFSGASPITASRSCFAK